jgi:shikimate dehydrogenase
VIGHPVSHSRSPAIFSFLSARRGLAGFRYFAKDILPEQLGSFLSEQRSRPEFLGLNVTIPHKEAIFACVDELSDEAQALRAVNVVHCDSGVLRGHNTDVFGVIRTLKEQHGRIEGKAVWIWGAGGAARAVAYAVGKLGALEVFVLNRSIERAEKMTREMAAIFPQTRFHAVAEIPRNKTFSLVVNSTPMGMQGYPQDESFFSSLRQASFEKNALAFDLIYQPEETVFLKLATDLGLRTVGGMDMLIYQALATWEIWFGSREDETELLRTKSGLGSHLRAIFSGAIRPVSPDQQPIFLSGFMGVGKSTVGIALADRLGWTFVDTDQLVVEAAKMSIPDIFRIQGESAFRELEKAALARVCEMKKAVISLGGGALMNPESMALAMQSGKLVYLKADAAALQQRLRRTASSRPLLSGLDAASQTEKIQSLLASREPTYLSAPYQVDTDELSPEEVAKRIEALLFGESAEERE